MQTSFPTYVRHRSDSDCNEMPYPMGNMPTYECSLKDLRIHDDDYVDKAYPKSFLRYQNWWLEMSDELFRKICPCDLNGVPCPFDELGDCRKIRLCSMVRRFRNPKRGVLPYCCGEDSMYHAQQCKYLHHIRPTCRSIQKQVAYSGPIEQFRSWQTCDHIHNIATTQEYSFCDYGHDFESARVESLWRYQQHVYDAKRKGAKGIVKKDIYDYPVWTPIQPDVRTLTNLHYDPEHGQVKGRTFHGNGVTISVQIYRNLKVRSERLCETTATKNNETKLFHVFSYRDSPETLKMYNTSCWMRKIAPEEDITKATDDTAGIDSGNSVVDQMRSTSMGKLKTGTKEYLEVGSWSKECRNLLENCGGGSSSKDPNTVKNSAGVLFRVVTNEDTEVENVLDDEI